MTFSFVEGSGPVTHLECDAKELALPVDSKVSPALPNRRVSVSQLVDGKARIRARVPKSSVLFNAARHS